MTAFSPEKYARDPLDVSFPLCNFLEGKHILNLLISYMDQTRPDISEVSLYYGDGKLTTANCLSKANPIRNRIILRCSDVPALEGLTVNSENDTVYRPYYRYARVSKAIDSSGTLEHQLYMASLGRDESERNLLRNSGNYLDLLLNLLILNDVSEQVGDSFRKNIIGYSNWAKSKSGFDKKWS